MPVEVCSSRKSERAVGSFVCHSKICRVCLEKYLTIIQEVLRTTSSSSSRSTFNFIRDRCVSLLENRLWTRGGRFAESKLLTAGGDGSVDLAVDIIRRSWCSVAICLRRKSRERERRTISESICPSFAKGFVRLRSLNRSRFEPFPSSHHLFISSLSLSLFPRVSSFSLSSFLFSFARFPFAEAETSECQHKS